MEENEEEDNRRVVTLDYFLIIACLIIHICVNLLVGLELQSGVIEHVPMAIIDYDDSQLSRQLIRYFRENDSFDVQYQIQDEEQLHHLLDTSKVRVGMVINRLEKIQDEAFTDSELYYGRIYLASYFYDSIL